MNSKEGTASLTEAVFFFLSPGWVAIFLASVNV